MSELKMIDLVYFIFSFHFYLFFIVDQGQRRQNVTPSQVTCYGHTLM